MAGPRIFLSAGEHSGERIACALMDRIRERHPDATFFGVGGELMKEHGFELHYDLSQRSIMWFWDALTLIPHFVLTILNLGRLMARERPDAAVAIDSPAFNMYMMKRAHELGIPSVYYVAPQAWAYNPSRTLKLRKWVKRLLVVLPFEVEFFRARGVQSTYVGHPLFEQLSARSLDDDLLREGGDATTLGILPGSRKSEVERSLPTMLRVAEGIAERIPDLRVVISIAKPSLSERVRELAKTSSVSPVVIDGGTAEIISASRLCLVTSGTVTLETSFYETPALVLYRISALNMFLGRPWILGDHIALPNLVADARIIDEFLTSGMPIGEMTQRALAILSDERVYSQAVEGQRSVRRRMLEEPRASHRAAEEICDMISRRRKSH